jgi:hypothetical protein
MDDGSDRMLSFLRRNLDRIVFAVGAALLVFGYGVAVGKLRLFPHDMIEAAAEAGRDWRENWRHYLGIRSRWLQPTARTATLPVHDPARAWAGHTFVTQYKDGAFGGDLLAMDGTVLHHWKLPLPEIWRTAGYAAAPMADEDATTHGAELLPGGDVVMSIGGYVVARIDACSRVVWAKQVAAHHAIDLQASGKEILAPGMIRHEKSNPAWPRLRLGPSGYVEDQTVLKIALEDGRVLEEFSILDAIYESGWEGLLFAGRGSTYAMAESDPLHMNDVETLRPEMAAAFPMFRAGDLLVSLRNLQTLVVLDGGTHKIKWSMTGPFYGQHDPDFAPDGRILLFDNRISGLPPQLGQSRVLAIDPATREVAWQHEGSAAEPFYTPIAGKVQHLPNGNVLALSPQDGTVLELAPDGRGGSEIVWEYVNLVEPGTVGMLFDMTRVPTVSEPWVGKACG